MRIDHDKFMQEYHGFREIMWSPEYTPEQKIRAWSKLVEIYFTVEDCGKENQELRQSAMEILVVEFPLRMGLELSAKLEALYGKYEYKPPCIQLGSPCNVGIPNDYCMKHRPPNKTCHELREKYEET